MATDNLAIGKDWSLSQLLTKPDMNDGEQRLAVTEQLASLATIAPLFLFAQLITGGVVILSFWGEGTQSLLSLWVTVLSLATGLLMFGYRYLRNWPDTRPFTEEHHEALATAVLALGIIWGALPVVLTPFTDPMGHRTLGVILAGTIFVGGFMLSRVPRVASSFVWPVAIGIVISLQLSQDARNDLLSIVTIVHAAVVVFCIHLAHRVFLEELRSRVALKDQGQVIGILLRDFGESTSDWLWQTDHEARIRKASIDVDGLNNPDEARFTGKHLAELFHPSEARTILERSIQRHQPFRDLVLALDMGPDEYQVWWSLTGKPVYEDGRFTGFRGVASDVTRTKEHESRIAYMAHYDGLTGLPNRMTLLKRLSEEMASPSGEGTFALVLFDLDNFKWVNDTLGHPAGDALLQMVAERVSGLCIEDDLIARLGGDEFAVLARRENAAALEAWLDRLISEMATPYELWGSTVLCSISAGLRIVEPGMDDADQMMKHADLALYQAKDKGRSRWEAFTDKLETRARERREIEDDLQTALAREEIVVHFQPQIAAATGELVSCEALIRWNHPRRGLVMPGAFITHAEDMGLIGQLGEWAIRASLRDARRLPDKVSVAVNMSPLQIHSSNLIATIVNALAQTGVAAERLELEITESVLMTDTEFTLERLHKIKELGVRIALDDFGTGYSSLSYLRAFPFDKIKIDQSFVRGLEESADSRAITEATIGLAKSLRMKVTAEGVETEFQRQFLASHGVDTLQGWLISKAIPIEEMARFADLGPEEILPRASVHAMRESAGTGHPRARAARRGLKASG
jgi:diguanylate cyclase (GGDEF)-like protein